MSEANSGAAQGTRQGALGEERTERAECIVLKQVRARIESPGHFIRSGEGIGHCAQNESGRWVMAMDSRAVAWSIRGAMFVQELLSHKAGQDQAYGDAEKALLAVIRKESRYEWKKPEDYLCMQEHDEILAILDRAIELADADSTVVVP
jgi:hypothetical protein